MSSSPWRKSYEAHLYRANRTTMTHIEQPDTNPMLSRCIYEANSRYCLIIKLPYLPELFKAIYPVTTKPSCKIQARESHPQDETPKRQGIVGVGASISTRLRSSYFQCTNRSCLCVLRYSNDRYQSIDRGSDSSYFHRKLF